MSKIDCETICMAAMARADGYVSEVSAEQIDAHLADCETCLKDLSELRVTTSLLEAHHRQQSTEDIWERIAPSLPAASTTTRLRTKAWYPFLALSIVLITHRLIGLIPDAESGVLFKLAPVLFVIAVFIYLRENPFKINVALKLEGE